MIEAQTSREPVVCADGFKVSIQASEFNYCSPRENGHSVIYTEVELGFPNREDNLIKEYVEDLSKDDEDIDYTDSVYPYVPSHIVALMIASHGGIIGGECPRLGRNTTVLCEIPIMKGADDVWNNSHNRFRIIYIYD